MNYFEIIGTVGNKFTPSELKMYKRKMNASDIIRTDDCIRITFTQNDKERMDDYFSRMKHQGGSDSYFLHFITDDKWIESRIIEEENDLEINFYVFKEGRMIIGDILEI